VRIACKAKAWHAHVSHAFAFLHSVASDVVSCTFVVISHSEIQILSAGAAGNVHNSMLSCARER
jgi:hypothetical protein